MKETSKDTKHEDVHDQPIEKEGKDDSEKVLPETGKELIEKQSPVIPPTWSPFVPKKE